MIKDLIVAALWSISPFGEAKVGIPYGITHGVDIFLVLIVCYLANVLVFPIMLFFLESVNVQLVKWRFYRGWAVKLAQKAKRNTKETVRKYGFFGLLFFVMLPFPGTGVYAGTIAAYVLKIERKKAFWANCIGILISSLIVWSTTLFAVNLF